MHSAPQPAPPASPEGTDQVASRRALVAAAWFTHIYTAAGAVLAFLATAAIVSGDLRLAFLWLAIAVIVDSTDGFLARALRVRERLPEVNGSHLDDIVDYLTYVFVPAFLLYDTGRLPAGWAVPVAAAMLMSSAIAFAMSDAKTSDHFFTGFPSYWNFVAFYLVALDVPPWLNACLLLVLSALVFVRIGYVYPSRTPALRGLTVLLGCAWGAALIHQILRFPATSRTWLLISLAFPAYYAVVSLVLHARRK